MVVFLSADGTTHQATDVAFPAAFQAGVILQRSCGCTKIDPLLPGFAGSGNSILG
jgi:hypothetical protein